MYVYTNIAYITVEYMCILCGFVFMYLTLHLHTLFFFQINIVQIGKYWYIIVQIESPPSATASGVLSHTLLA